MSFVTSPNMSLPIPVVGQEPGPDYASDVNNSLTLVDGHDHTPGRGVPITVSALNINANLTLNGHFATSVAGVTLVAQGSTPSNNTVYESGPDLFFVDGVGNNIRLTQNGGIAGTPGSISNLVPPASASYVAGNSTFVWQSDVNTAANMDAGSLLLRNLTPNSTFALTLAPPASLSSNYQIVLPLLPTSQKIVTLDNSGNMTAPYSFDDFTITTTSNVINVLRVPDGAITTSQIADGAVTNPKMATDSVSTANIIDQNVTTAKIADASLTSVKFLDDTIAQSRIQTHTANNITLPGGSVITGSSYQPIAFMGIPGALINRFILVVLTTPPIASASQPVILPGAAGTYLQMSTPTWSSNIYIPANSPAAVAFTFLVRCSLTGTETITFSAIAQNTTTFPTMIMTATQVG